MGLGGLELQALLVEFGVLPICDVLEEHLDFLYCLTGLDESIVVAHDDAVQSLGRQDDIYMISNYILDV